MNCPTTMQTPARRGRFLLCALVLASTLTGCDLVTSDRSADFAAIRTGINGSSREETVEALGRPTVLWSEELAGISAEKLAFDHGRTIYVVYFINGKAVRKSAGKEMQ